MALTTFVTDTAIASTPMNLNFTYLPPVGTVLPWLKSFTGVPGTLPEGYMECDGSVVSDAGSPLNGETLPDLNGDNRFLRGSSTSGTTGGSDTKDLTHQHFMNNIEDVNGTGVSWGFNSSNPTTQDGGSATQDILPSYYEVVWIIRFK